MNISFIGAGHVALSLGQLIGNAGHTVKYGTRFPEKSEVSIATACTFGDIIFLAIPYSALPGALEPNRELLKGKIVVDVTNAINIEDWSPLFLGEDSGGEQLARMLPESQVVKAFNTIFADVMKTDKQQFEGHPLTVFIASEHPQAADLVKKIADDAGFNGLVLNGIRNSRYLEAMAHLNIAIALGGGGTDGGFVYVQRN